MSKYKLINNKTKEEHLCDKVTIDGFDYYVSDEKEQVVLGRFYYEHDNHVPIYSFTECTLPEQYYLPQVIATTNPNIDDVPKVVDEVERLASNVISCSTNVDIQLVKEVWKAGYNKSQETHPFSEEDMIEFGDWVYRSQFDVEGYTQDKETKELLQLWKEQKPKTLYYE